MEIQMFGKTETMHCIRCGSTEFEPVKDYTVGGYQWYKCGSCGIEFRSTHVTADDEDDRVYAEEVVFVDEQH